MNSVSRNAPAPPKAAGSPNEGSEEIAKADASGLDLFAAMQSLHLQHYEFRAILAERLRLTHSEFDAFLLVAGRTRLTPKQLAGSLRFTTGATTALIDRLDRAGLVHRVPHPHDRRSVLLELRRDGEAALTWVTEQYAHIARTTFTLLDSDAGHRIAIIPPHAVGRRCRGVEHVVSYTAAESRPAMKRGVRGTSQASQVPASGIG